jgi:hypothetical protein
VATVRDPTIDRLLDTPSDDDGDLAATVVAADVFERKRAAALALIESGIDVIDAPTESLSRRCVSAYLTAKRLARV